MDNLYFLCGNIGNGIVNVLVSLSYGFGGDSMNASLGCYSEIGECNVDSERAANNDEGKKRHDATTTISPIPNIRNRWNYYYPDGLCFVGTMLAVRKWGVFRVLQVLETTIITSTVGSSDENTDEQRKTTISTTTTLTPTTTAITESTATATAITIPTESTSLLVDDGGGGSKTRRRLVVH